MSLKRKIAIRISIAFTLLFAMVMLIIYFSFNDFRKGEFENRFKQRLVFTIRFIEQSKDFDEEAPIFFNENADNVLLNEQILIFNDEKKLIYSTVKDESIKWDDFLLEQLDKTPTIYRADTDPEIYAAYRKIKNRNYYILTSAKDVNGLLKLDYLKYLLLFSFVISVLLIGFLSYYFMGKFLSPLEKLNQKIKNISSSSALEPIDFVNSHDEIATLTLSFNTMMERLKKVFDAQKSFTSSASHELKTPLTRMAFQLENMKAEENLPTKNKEKIEQIIKEVYQLSDLTQSLLLLAKLEEQNNKSHLEEVRIDEVIDDAFQTVQSHFPFLKLNFSVSQADSEHTTLIVLGIKPLLEIVFINLFKNAAIYSTQPNIDVQIDETMYSLYIHINSIGNTISEKDQKNLFNAFVRGENAQNIPGSGLGLRIVKRILEFHNAEITYQIPSENVNCFTLAFKKQILLNL